MTKTLDLNHTVAQLVKEYPEVKEIMVSIGFRDITNPIALQVMGSHITLKKGSRVKGIPMDTIIHAFEEKGYLTVTRKVTHC